MLDEDGQRAARRARLGEIAFHGSTGAMFLGYWNGVDGPVPVGEWQRTGDLGRRDEDGYLWHEGRRDDVILSSGYRIGPGEVEECLAQHPAVRAVAVVGEPDELRGQVVSAVARARTTAPRPGSSSRRSSRTPCARGSRRTRCRAASTSSTRSPAPTPARSGAPSSGGGWPRTHEPSPPARPRASRRSCALPHARPRAAEPHGDGRPRHAVHRPRAARARRRSRSTTSPTGRRAASG